MLDFNDLSHIFVSAQCLYTITDHNEDIYSEFKNHPEYAVLLASVIDDTNNDSVTHKNRLLLRILACGMK